MHGYSYESLLYDDILNEDQKGFEEYQQLPLEIFNQFRYRHISHALTELPAKLNKVVEQVKSEKVEALEVKELFEEQEKLKTHVALILRLWEKYQEKELRDLG